MKIGIIMDVIAKGGVTKLAILEVKEMIKQGYNVELLVLWRYKNDTTYEDILGTIPVRYIYDEIPLIFRKLNFKIPLFSFFSLYHLTSVIFLPMIIKKKEYDFFITHGTFTCFSSITTKWIRKIPYIAYIHDSIYYIIKKAYLNNAGFFKTIYFSIARGAGYWVDKFICKTALGVAKQSKHESDYFINRHKVTNFAIVTSATYERIPEPRKEVGNYFLAFTKWDFTKNFDMILEIACKLPDIIIKVAGFWHPEKYREEIQSQIDSRGLGRQIIILGPVKEDEIKNLYYGARALIHPLFEAWGATLYEAACTSTTMVAVKGSGVCDYLQDGKDGFFLDQNDREGFGKKVELLMEKPDLALEMGINAWETIKQVDITNHVKILLSIITNRKIKSR